MLSVFEGQVPSDHNIQHNTKAPNIDLRAVVLLGFPKFRSAVMVRIRAGEEVKAEEVKGPGGRKKRVRETYAA
jgi:hypothetical protein